MDVFYFVTSQTGTTSLKTLVIFNNIIVLFSLTFQRAETITPFTTALMSHHPFDYFGFLSRVYCKFVCEVQRPYSNPKNKVKAPWCQRIILVYKPTSKISQSKVLSSLYVIPLLYRKKWRLHVAMTALYSALLKYSYHLTFFTLCHVTTTTAVRRNYWD